MVEPAENRTRENPAEPLDRSMTWRIFDEGQMRSDVIVIGDVDSKNPTQVGLVKDDDMIEAFPADRADQPFRVPVLPG